MGLGFNDGFKPDQFWEHWCRVEKDIMSFEKGVPCDWCGATEKNQKYKQQDMTELNADGNRTRGRYGEEILDKS